MAVDFYEFVPDDTVAAAAGIVVFLESEVLAFTLPCFNSLLTACSRLHLLALLISYTRRKRQPEHGVDPSGLILRENDRLVVDAEPFDPDHKQSISAGNVHRFVFVFKELID
jgi:hypothetical protein